MKLLFIVGTGRCGSSLIHELLAAHQDVGFISNIDDNLRRLNLSGRFNNLLFRSQLGRLTKKGGFRYAPSEAYRLIAEQVSPVYADSSRDLLAEDVTPWLSQRFTEFFSRRYEAQGKPLFLHKYTGWSRIGFFAKMFPDAQFVHVVRDGRAVANSWLQMPWWNGYLGPENWHWGPLPDPYRQEWIDGKRSYVLLAAIAWKILVDSYQLGSAGLGTEKIMTIRYEDFLENPPQTLRSILEFAGLSWTDAFATSLNRRKIYDGRTRAYEKDLSSSQLDELEKSLREKLVQYGYL